MSILAYPVLLSSTGNWTQIWFDKLTTRSYSRVPMAGWFEIKKKRIFMDYASATPVFASAKKEMEKYWSEDFYNPNAIYREGENVKKIVRDCRERIAKLLGVSEDSIIFTSGGTEANVLAIRGVKPGKIVVEPESHPSVVEAARGVNGTKVTLYSSVIANNKLGRKIREERKRNGSDYPLLHIDASQTAQYVNVGLETLACDLLTLDSAKIYGPKGVGVLVVRRGIKLNLPPLGTPPVPLIVGFTKALEIVVADRESEFKRLDILSKQFIKAIESNLQGVSITYFAPNVINISVPKILPELLVLVLDSKGVLVSAGPACNSNKPEPPDTPVRFSFGRPTTESEVKQAAEIFCSICMDMVK